MTRHHLRQATKMHLAAAAAGLLLGAWPLGCSDDGSGSRPGGGAGAGAASSSGDGGFTGSGGSGPGGFDACATATVLGDRVPVQMYIMFDKSGSMLEDQKWAGAKAALIAFFQDDDSAGLRIALRFFPDDDPVAGCNESACSAAACATPLVDVGELNDQPAYGDPQQAALVSAVESKAPGGQTPMYAALAGATQWASAHASADVVTAVALVTDGLPNGCNEDAGAIASLAAGALSAAGVLTYAIGMEGADIGQLDQVAAAGGTEQAFVVGGGTVHKDLVAAFEAIGTMPLECVLPMPDPAEVGQQIEPGEVNVTYTHGDGAEEAIGQVAGAASCGAGGWYYDDPVSPTQIELCPQTCELVQADAGAELGIVLGCKTVLK